MSKGKSKTDAQMINDSITQILTENNEVWKVAQITVIFMKDNVQKTTKRVKPLW